MASAKQFLFLTIFALYTLALLAYVAFRPDQDWFLAHARETLYAALVALPFALGLAVLVRRHPRARHVALVLAFLLSIVVSLRVTEASWNELLNPGGLAGAWRLWSGMTHPNLELLPRAIALTTETIFIAFLATVLAIPPAFVLAFFAAKNVMTGRGPFAVYLVLRGVLNVTRSVEPLIWALIFTVWVGVGPFAGMLALMVHSVASLIKYYSEIIEGVSEGPLDGIRSTGASPLQVVWYGIVPQILLPYIGMTVYRWDTNVRMATVIGLVGGGGIGTLLIQYQGQALWAEVGCIILVIAFVVWLMDTASAYLREALK